MILEIPQGIWRDLNVFRDRHGRQVEAQERIADALERIADALERDESDALEHETTEIGEQA